MKRETFSLMQKSKKKREFIFLYLKEILHHCKRIHVFFFILEVNDIVKSLKVEFLHEGAIYFSMIIIYIYIFKCDIVRAFIFYTLPFKCVLYNQKHYVAIFLISAIYY